MKAPIDQLSLEYQVSQRPFHSESRFSMTVRISREFNLLLSNDRVFYNDLALFTINKQLRGLQGIFKEFKYNSMNYSYLAEQEQGDESESEDVSDDG